MSIGVVEFIEKCLVCGEEVYDYEPQIEPPLCSQECADKLIGGIAK